jgi:hypothetical protein
LSLGETVGEAKTGQNRAKIGKISIKTKETCGKRAFSVDFAWVLAAL